MWVARFQDIAWPCCFDGIWACASLLHVPSAELLEVMTGLTCGLKPGGTMYVSFKHGRGERDYRGRRFTDMDEAGLAALLKDIPELVPHETWVTSDLRPGRAAEPWLNTILFRRGRYQ